MESIQEKSNKNGHANQLNDNFDHYAEERFQAGSKTEIASLKNARIYNKGQAGIAVRRAPTRRLKTAIALYMPPQVSVTYGSNYTDTEIGGGVALVIDSVMLIKKTISK